MALITRVSRLFRADVNAVLDRMEEPELLLKQATREMEEELDRDEQRAKLLALELRQIASRQGDLTQRLDNTAEELDLCFDSGNEALARALLKRRLETERFIEFLSRKHEALCSAADELKRRIDGNRSRLEGMRQKTALFTIQEPDDEVVEGWAEPAFVRQFAVSDEDVELALLREQQKRVQS
ncbi:MAG: PspA/IM30 family protein [Candidatus Thiodiazotropha sp. (ex Dulcina madagascariensis)]|nr:PspA/IM30 family protein [Candidatus Thiodiazotropha sp. (ex Dulcina madagascariensis)]MCU7928805.1 PspA/IM30 family protein [Candidatus Thiodiazotropha sp. (ex Dulcina madagascariensis)]